MNYEQFLDQKTQLGWSFKQTLTVSHQIEDPKQEKLPLDEPSVTIKNASGEVLLHTTQKQFKRLSKKASNDPR